jgi:ATP-binding cassette subfamily F protein 3
VLILDEPGNHLDVETVEALATALIKYEGTVIFTSHDRHFMHRVATDVVEVRDARVVSYPSSYDDYVYRVQKEIDAGLRAEAAAHGKSIAAEPDKKARARADRDTEKRLKGVERKIAKLDAERKEVQVRMANVVDATEAQRLHAENVTISKEIETLEAEWLTLYEALEGV